MASIIMKRGTTSEISNTPISDGQILFETDTKNIYIDEGSNRIDYRATTIDIDNKLSTTSENPVQNKVITTNINDLEDRVGQGFDDCFLSTDAVAVIPTAPSIVTYLRSDIHQRYKRFFGCINLGSTIPAGLLDFKIYMDSLPSQGGLFGGLNETNCSKLTSIAGKLGTYLYRININTETLEKTKLRLEAFTQTGANRWVYGITNEEKQLINNVSMYYIDLKEDL